MNTRTKGTSREKKSDLGEEKRSGMRPNVFDYAFPHLSAVPHKQVRVCMNASTVQGDTVICKKSNRHTTRM